MRERAFTLFIVAYDRVRSALRHMFPDTYEQILPNFRVTRGPGKKQLTEDEIAQEIRTATGVHAVVKEPATAPDAEPEAPAAAVGMPGSNPYSG